MDALIIDIPVYKTYVELYAFEKIDTSKGLLEHKYKNIEFEIKEDSVGYSSWFKNKGENKFIIVITNETNVATIAHECVHLTWYILESVGVKVNLENHESQAYLLEYIIFEIIKLLKNEKQYIYN